jgi:hypothetical protein
MKRMIERPMKRTILVVFLTLATMLLATPSFACGHCDGRFCFIDDFAGDCQLGPHSCTNIVCSGLTDEPAMLSQYTIAAVEVAHAMPGRGTAPAAATRSVIVPTQQVASVEGTRARVELDR